MREEGETERKRSGGEDNIVLHCSSRANKCYYFVKPGSLFAVPILSELSKGPFPLKTSSMTQWRKDTWSDILWPLYQPLSLSLSFIFPFTLEDNNGAMGDQEAIVYVLYGLSVALSMFC